MIDSVVAAVDPVVITEVVDDDMTVNSAGMTADSVIDRTDALVWQKLFRGYHNWYSSYN